MDYIIIENEKIGQVKAKLLVEKNPQTCKAIWESLPLELNLSRWGEELYGDIPVSIDSENPQVECEVGDIAYWISGSGFCIFFGKTPVSTSDKPKAASDINVFAHIEGDSTVFGQFRSFSGIVRKAS
ncbi:MAG: cyclophilin-like fold protein [Promethearchaeota archaeon]